MSKRNPEYVYKEDSKGRVLAYKPIVCEQCKEEALARVRLGWPNRQVLLPCMLNHLAA